MIFEVGKRYEHIGTGEKIFIAAQVDKSRIYYTPYLIAENEFGDLRPVGVGEDYSVNWQEVEE